MAAKKIAHKIRVLLYPFAVLFGIVIWIRHKLYDLKISTSTSFDLPLICVGNLTVGGTGKTPHIEYLAELLKKKHHIAVLSRGYKRKTSGFVLAKKDATPKTLGDEPYQIFKKYSDITVAVCEKRVVGVEQLLKHKPKLKGILLDDAYQHRKIKPGFNILLVDYNRPIFSDHLLPVGNLRDIKSQAKRADIIIVSKTPKSITDIEKRLWIKQISPYPYQKLFFSTIDYQALTAVYNKRTEALNINQLANKYSDVLLLTGIANPKPLLNWCKTKGLKTQLIDYPDHYDFTSDDLLKIEKEFNAIEGKKKLILTTEKDAVKLRELKNIPEVLKKHCYYLPIKISFLDNTNHEFDKIILDYVAKNKKVGQLYS